MYRREVLHGDEILYVVGVDQTLHFDQVFTVLKRMKYDWADHCHHIAFGMYRFKDIGKMSTRKGNVIFMEDVLERAIKDVDQLMSEKITDNSLRSKIAEIVGIGAIIFNDLKNDRQKNVDFDWASVLNFEGDSGPYLQYVVVRCKSIERKLGEPIRLEMPKPLDSVEEQNLILAILSFDETLSAAYRNFKPNILATYLLDLSHAFNVFYHHHKVLQETDLDLRQGRLALCKATQMVLEKGLDILGIRSPDQM
jgi:arginyl-tRNA synthetase